MIKKASKYSVFLLLCIFISTNLSCKSGSPESPEVKKSANVEISIDNEPVYLTLNWYKEMLEGNVTITLRESNGVGCTLDSIEVKFLYRNYTYEPKTLGGAKLSPYESVQVSTKLSTETLYEGIRIFVKGTDDNAHSMSKSEDFALEYLPGLKGNYQGEITGTQLGNICNSIIRILPAPMSFAARM